MALRSSVSLVLPARSLCCHIRTATTAVVTYYLLSTVLVLVDMVSVAIKGRDACGFVYSKKLTHSQRIFDITSNFLLVAVMIVSSVFALLGLWKRSAHQMVPFIVLLFLDAALTLMSLFSSQWGLPGTPTFEQGHRIMELLSSEKGKALAPAEMAHLAMVFSVFFVLYLLMKVYMAQTVLRYYFVTKAQAQESTRDEKSVSVDLPSYDEALKLPSKAQLPAHQQA